MPLELVRNDIVKMEVDAIVCPTDPRLSGGGGVDEAVRRAAGPGLGEACARLGGCRPGEAKATGGFALPCRYVIHTVGPRWFHGRKKEKEVLSACYGNSLKLAAELGCRTAAFPLISTGHFGYPKARALKTAMEEIGAFLSAHDMQVYLVIFDEESFRVSRELTGPITEYISREYAEKSGFDRRTAAFSAPLQGGLPSMPPPPPPPPAQRSSSGLQRPRPSSPAVFHKPRPKPMEEDSFEAKASLWEGAPDLAELKGRLGQLDESFSQMLLRLIDEKGMTDAQCYKKANIDRRLFSKIRSDVHYKPSKTTVVAFIVALELPMEEAEEMLQKAGFSLSHSSKFDLIIEYFLRRGVYDMFKINEALYYFDQVLLGS